MLVSGLSNVSSFGLAYAQMAGITSPSAPSSSFGARASSANQVAVPIQSESYQRANENLSTQAIYLQNRIKTLESEDSDGLAGRSDELAAETQNFCDGSSGDNETCLKNYIETERRQLKSLEAPMIHNDTSIVNLQSDAVCAGNAAGVSGACKNGQQLNPSAHMTTFGVSVSAGKTVQDPLQPYVPTFEDLSRNYKSSGPAPMASWVPQAVAPPNPADYYETEAVLVDPSDPSKGTENTLVLANGKPVVGPGYAQALAEYNSHKDAYANYAQGVVGSARAAAQSNVLQNNAQNGLVATVGANPSRDASKDTSLIRQDYIAARNLVVQTFNGGGQIAPPAKSIAFGPASTSSSGLGSGSGQLTPQQQAQQQQVQDRATADAAIGKEDALNPPSAQTANRSLAGKSSVDSLYMDPSDIDGFLAQDLQNQQQLGSPQYADPYSPSK